MYDLLWVEMFSSTFLFRNKIIRTSFRSSENLIIGWNIELKNEITVFELEIDSTIEIMIFNLETTYNVRVLCILRLNLISV